ncbi:hypothetical protein HRbin36_02430 [bacterium HR36]|nr:hypothetical protein HRbin36_02430 [bacterium HR36]
MGGARSGIREVGQRLCQMTTSRALRLPQVSQASAAHTRLSEFHSVHPRFHGLRCRANFFNLRGSHRSRSLALGFLAQSAREYRCLLETSSAAAQPPQDVRASAHEVNDTFEHFFGAPSAALGRSALHFAVDDSLPRRLLPQSLRGVGMFGDMERAGAVGEVC